MAESHSYNLFSKYNRILFFDNWVIIGLKMSYLESPLHMWFIIWNFSLNQLTYLYWAYLSAQDLQLLFWFIGS